MLEYYDHPLIFSIFSTYNCPFEYEYIKGQNIEMKQFLKHHRFEGIIETHNEFALQDFKNYFQIFLMRLIQFKHTITRVGVTQLTEEVYMDKCLKDLHKHFSGSLNSAIILYYAFYKSKAEKAIVLWADNIAKNPTNITKYSVSHYTK